MLLLAALQAKTAINWVAQQQQQHSFVLCFNICVILVYIFLLYVLCTKPKGCDAGHAGGVKHLAKWLKSYFQSTTFFSLVLWPPWIYTWSIVTSPSFLCFLPIAMVPVQIGIVAQGARIGTFGRTFIRINGLTTATTIINPTTKNETHRTRPLIKWQSRASHTVNTERG